MIESRTKCWPIRSLFTYTSAWAARDARPEYFQRYGWECYIDLAEEKCPPIVSDGVVLWLAYAYKHGSGPSRIQLSYSTWAEGVRAVQSLRARLRRIPLARAFEYDDQRKVEEAHEAVLRQFAEDNGFREDHHIVWHSSPAWLDREVSPGSTYKPGQTWRDLSIERGRDVSCWDEVTA